MKLQQKLTISFALAAMALGLTTTQASAQPVLKGVFELPAPTYFGDALLQPGQYMVWMSTEASELAKTSVIHVSGEGVSKTFLAIGRPKPQSGKSYLEITDMDGTYVVNALDAGSLGRSFGFGATKAVRKVLRANAGSTIALKINGF